MKLFDNKEVGDILKKFRLEMNIRSVRKYATEAGLDQSHYSKVERGELPLTEAMIEKLQKKYGLKKEMIFQNIGKNVPHGTLSATGYGTSDVTAKITGVNKEVIDKKVSIERSIELLTEDRMKVLSVIERLTTLLERQYLNDLHEESELKLENPGSEDTTTEYPKEQKIKTQ